MFEEPYTKNVKLCTPDRSANAIQNNRYAHVKLGCLDDDSLLENLNVKGAWAWRSLVGLLLHLDLHTENMMSKGYRTLSEEEWACDSDLG